MSVDRYFRISERGSTFAREIRGGFATFFTMAYILVLNPIILGSATDKFGHHLDAVQLTTATALVARRIKGSLLFGIVFTTVLAMVVNYGWGHRKIWAGTP
ncbi:MAG: hypothetical protein ACJ736_14855, partial [Streptomyces sp.]